MSYDEVWDRQFVNYFKIMLYHWNLYIKYKDSPWRVSFHLRRVWVFLYALLCLLEK